MGRTKVGWFGWVGEQTEGFAKALGFEPKSVAVHRRQHLRELEPGLADRLYAEAEPHAGDYELLRIAGPTPDDLLPALAEATAAINDAPLDDLEMEDEVFTADRVRAYEQAQLASGFRFYRIVARHRDVRRARRTVGRHRRLRRTRDAATRRTPRSSGATAATGSGSCSRPT